MLTLANWSSLGWIAAPCGPSRWAMLTRRLDSTWPSSPQNPTKQLLCSLVHDLDNYSLCFLCLVSAFWVSALQTIMNHSWLLVRQRSKIAASQGLANWRATNELTKREHDDHVHSLGPPENRLKTKNSYGTWPCFRTKCPRLRYCLYLTWWVTRSPSKLTRERALVDKMLLLAESAEEQHCGWECHAFTPWFITAADLPSWRSTGAVINPKINLNKKGSDREPWESSRRSWFFIIVDSWSFTTLSIWSALLLTSNKQSTSTVIAGRSLAGVSNMSSNQHSPTSTNLNQPTNQFQPTESPVAASSCQ